MTQSKGNEVNWIDRLKFPKSILQFTTIQFRWRRRRRRRCHHSAHTKIMDSVVEYAHKNDTHSNAKLLKQQRVHSLDANAQRNEDIVSWQLKTVFDKQQNKIKKSGVSTIESALTNTIYVQQQKKTIRFGTPKPPKSTLEPLRNRCAAARWLEI